MKTAVINHVYSLIGYNQNDQVFNLQPYKLRQSAAVNAFLSGLPSVLDRNFSLGSMLLPVVVRLLKYLPSPSFASAEQQSDKFHPLATSDSQNSENAPHYTICLLNSQSRHSWLLSFLITLYKVKRKLFEMLSFVFV